MNKEQLFTIFENIYGDPSYFQENKHIILTCILYFLVLFYPEHFHLLLDVDLGFRHLGEI